MAKSSVDRIGNHVHFLVRRHSVRRMLLVVGALTVLWALLTALL